MKKLFILLFLGGWLLLPCGLFAQIRDVTVYCDDTYAPYSYGEDGTAKGIYTEILQAAFSKMSGYHVTIKPIAWKRGLAYLAGGEGFALFPPYYRPMDRPFMDYSVPILDEELVVFVRDDLMHPPRQNWVKDYRGLAIGINIGFASIKPEDRQQLNVVEIKNAEVGLLNIGLKRLDGYVNDRISILWALKKLKASGEYKNTFPTLVQGATLSKEQGFVGFTNKDKGKFDFKEDFKRRLNALLEEMKARGEIQAIIDKYIK